MAEEKKRHKKGGFLIFLGALLLLASLGITGYNLYTSERAARVAAEEVADLLTVIEEREADPDSTDYLLNPDWAMPVVTVQGRDYIGVLYFEDLDLTLPVFAEWNYINLADAPCLYTGNIARGNMVICAHNFTTQFTQIKTLPEGSEVIFTDVNGVEYIYQVVSRETVQPTDVTTMCAGDGWDLTLFTCNTGGQTRCAVRCQLIETRDPGDATVIFSVENALNP